MERPIYHVTVTREDDLWVAEVNQAELDARARHQGIPHINVTDVARFEDIGTEVSDFIANMTDTDEDDFDVVYRYVTPAGQDYTTALLAARDTEIEFRVVAAARDSAREQAVLAMRNAGLTLRAIADVLGLSYQRIAQIAHAA